MFFDKKNLAALHHSEDRKIRQRGASCKASRWWHQLFASFSSQGQWHPNRSTIWSRTHLPCTTQLLSEVSKWQWQWRYVLSPIRHTASASWKNQHQALACKPSCSKTSIKPLQLSQIPDRSDRDSSKGSSSYGICYIFMWVPGPMCWFLLPLNHQCMSPAETSFDKQKYPKPTRSQLGEGVGFFLMLSSFPRCMLWILTSSNVCRGFLFFPPFDSPLRKENGWFTFGL